MCCTCEVTACTCEDTACCTCAPPKRVCPPNDPCAALRTRPTWFIDPVNGSDASDGATAVTALRTWAELQRRWGNYTELCPVGGVLRVEVLGDLPVEDPVTFRQILCPGTIVIVSGRERVVYEGVLQDVIDKNREANIPFQVVDANADWSGFVRLQIRAATGEKAWVLRDLGGGVAHVSTWVRDVEGAVSAVGGAPVLIGDVEPVAPPAPATAYRVVDFTTAAFSDMVVEYDDTQPAACFGEDCGVPGGIIFRQFQEVNPTLRMTYPRSLGSAMTIISFMDTIFNSEVYVEAGNENYVSANNMFANLVISFGGQLLLQAGAFVPREGTEYPGALRIEHAGVVRADGDPSFVGSFAENGTAADIQIFGRLDAGPLNFWNTLHAIVGFPSGSFRSLPFSPLYNESCYPPIWGESPAGGQLVFAPTFIWQIETFCVDQDCAVPTYVTPSGDGGGVIDVGNGAQLNTQAHAWLKTAAVYGPATPVTFDRLLLPVPVGFVTSVNVVSPEPGVTITSTFADATDPGTGARVTYICVNLAFAAASSANLAGLTGLAGSDDRGVSIRSRYARERGLSDPATLLLGRYRHVTRPDSA